MPGLTDPLPPPPRTVSKPSEPVGDLLTTEDLAETLHVSPGAIRAMHVRGTGPPSVKTGRRRMYPSAGFTEWLATR